MTICQGKDAKVERTITLFHHIRKEDGFVPVVVRASAASRTVALGLKVRTRPATVLLVSASGEATSKLIWHPRKRKTHRLHLHHGFERVVGIERWHVKGRRKPSLPGISHVVHPVPSATSTRLLHWPPTARLHLLSIRRVRFASVVEPTLLGALWRRECVRVADTRYFSRADRLWSLGLAALGLLRGRWRCSSNVGLVCNSLENIVEESLGICV